MDTKEKINYKKVFIIGNGFDLNLELKTSYADFINTEENFLFPVLLQDNNSLAKYLYEKHKKANWIDIEKELVNYAQTVTDDNYNLFKSEYKDLKKCLMQYLSCLDFTKINKKSSAYLLIKDNIKDFTENEFLILDFNYTPTLKNILVELGLNQESIDKHLIKMHGSLDKQDIILGIHDDAGKSNAQIFIKKSKNNSFRDDINLHYIMNNCENLFIFGHSLGKTDEIYFKKIFYRFSIDTGRQIKLNLYHHGEEAEEIFWQRIDDLVGSDITGFKKKIKVIPINTKI